MLNGLRSDLRLSGGHPVENIRGGRPSSSARDKTSGLTAGDRDAARRRYALLQHAEERLRPLRKTKLAEVYWRVYAELKRFERECAEQSGLEAGGSRLDGE